MSGSLFTAIVAGGSAIAGGVVVAGSNYLISRRNAGDVRQGGMRQTLVALVSVVSQIDHQLRTEPRSKRIVRVVNDQMETRFPQIDYITGRIHRRLFQPQLDELIVRLHDAMAAALLDAPPKLLGALEATSTVMSQVDQSSDDWWASWDEARGDLVRACRIVLGEPIRVVPDLSAA
jgi:hypothetical protein